jgi:hypothetical protein
MNSNLHAKYQNQMMLAELLQEVVLALEQRGIRYMISGSVALNAYSVPRMTRDIDIVIELEADQLNAFESIFNMNYYSTDAPLKMKSKGEESSM